MPWATAVTAVLPRLPLLSRSCRGYRGQLDIHSWIWTTAITAVLPRSIGHPFLELGHRGYRGLAAVTVQLGMIVVPTMKGQAKSAKAIFVSFFKYLGWRPQQGSISIA